MLACFKELVLVLFFLPFLHLLNISQFLQNNEIHIPESYLLQFILLMLNLVTYQNLMVLKTLLILC